MILVTGATGNVGRQVGRGLRDIGVPVRLMSRRPGPGLTTGDLLDPGGLPLDDVDSVFLIWPGPSATGVQAAVDALSGRVRHVVFLSAVSAENGFWGVVENALRATGVRWTFLRGGGFATNTLGWADMIRRDGAVRWPYGDAARSLIHERDVADVAVRVLTGAGHAGRTYELTGPAAISQAEQVRLIGEAIGRPLRWIEVPAVEARRQLLASWGGTLHSWTGRWLTGHRSPTIRRPSPAPSGSSLVRLHEPSGNGLWTTPTTSAELSTASVDGCRGPVGRA